MGTDNFKGNKRIRRKGREHKDSSTGSYKARREKKAKERGGRGRSQGPKRKSAETTKNGQGGQEERLTRLLTPSKVKTALEKTRKKDKEER